MGMNDRIRADKLEKESIDLKEQVERLKAENFELEVNYKYERQRADEAENLHRRLVEALAMTVANHLPKITGAPK